MILFVATRFILYICHSNHQDLHVECANELALFSES